MAVARRRCFKDFLKSPGLPDPGTVSPGHVAGAQTQNIENNPMQSRMGARLAALRRLAPRPLAIDPGGGSTQMARWPHPTPPQFLMNSRRTPFGAPAVSSR